jgi:hypothetical protein
MGRGGDRKLVVDRALKHGERYDILGLPPVEQAFARWVTG